MANCQDSYLFSRNHKAVKGDVTRLPVGNDQLPQLALHAATYKRVRGQVINRRLNRRHCVRRSIRIFVCQELKRAFDMIQRTR